MIHTARKKQFGLSALALFVLLLFLLVCVTLGLHWWRDTSGPALHPPRSRFDPLAHCATPHGTLLGYALDIPAFSNCHRRWNSKSQAFVTLEHPHDVRQEPFCWGPCDPAAPGSAGWRRSSLPAPTICTEACPSSMGRQMPPSTGWRLSSTGPW
ncbi:hypothetical protein C3747_45g233 [Trypanosoma cruzi]|uniref:Uncharacterized protein n=1 Tax=Trypanosoma cruzi TaxID=5693 RepID=A0A2V2WZ23_TRYCR|nr:hypothetical protein C3747_45g233 [Trypanosoma cruzi]